MIIKTLKKTYFLADFSIQNWSNLEDQNIDSYEKFNDFLWRVNSCVDRHAPMKRLSKKQIKLHLLKPQITNRIIKVMSHRDKLFLKWNKSQGDVQTHNAYKKFRNCARQEIRKSKREYYKNKFEMHKNNMKQLWSGIKNTVTTKIKSHHLISQIRVENVDYDDPKIIAYKFNNFFVNVAENIQKSIPNATKSQRDYLRSPNPQSIFLYSCTAKEVEDIIHLLNPTKVSGPYSIPVKLLKLLDNHISHSLSVLINDSFTIGIFPTKLNISKVTPLHKKGSNLDPNNYHPISLLSVFNKICEKVM